MAKKGEEIIFGHNNTFNAPSISISYKDNLFSENFDTSKQIQNSFLYSTEKDSLDQLKTLLDEKGISLSYPTKILFRTTWKPSLTKNFFKKRVGDENLAIFSQNVYLKNLPIVIFQIKKKIKSNSDKVFQHYKTDDQLSHAANAVYTSTFDKCAVMVIDDFGEKFSTTFYTFQNNSFKVIYKNRASLGKLYSSVAELCHLPIDCKGHSKMTDLSLTGKFNQSIYNFFSKKVRRRGLRFSIKFEIEDVKELKNILGSFQQINKEDLAYTFQDFFTDTIIDLATSLSNITKENNLAYGGSCALNHLTNGKILTHTPFKRIHIPSSPGDNGNSLGALLYQKYKVCKEPRSLSWPVFGSSPYLGKSFNEEKVEAILKRNHFYYEEVFEKNVLLKKVSALLAQGHIIGWVQGKAEFTLRGLGNRSILADPRDPSIKEKFQSIFEKSHFTVPFGVSVLHELGHGYFKNYQKSPYMEKSLYLKNEVAELLPGILHKDEPVQIHSVHKELNPTFHSLLKDFQELTKVPLLLNTNINVLKRSHAVSEEDIFSLLLTTKLKFLIIGNFIIKRS